MEKKKKMQLINGLTICKNILMEDMEQDVLNEMKENTPETKKDLGDGKVEYS